MQNLHDVDDVDDFSSLPSGYLENHFWNIPFC